MIQYQHRRFFCLTRNALKKFVTFSWQTGHSITLGAQASQQARCPQGERPMATLSSMQILHVSWFRKFMFSCFSALSSVKKIVLIFVFYFRLFIIICVNSSLLYFYQVSSDQSPKTLKSPHLGIIQPCKVSTNLPKIDFKCININVIFNASVEYLPLNCCTNNDKKH